MQRYELIPHYDGRKSFYKKAHVIIEGNESKLISYNTHVASVFSGVSNKNDVLEVYGTYSATTLRHIKEFMQQFNFPVMSKNEIEGYVIPNNITRQKADELFNKEDISKIQDSMIKHAQENIRKEAPWIL